MTRCDRAVPSSAADRGTECLHRGRDPAHPQGDIDTVLVVFPDLQGRLIGKRVMGGFFLDTVLGGSIEACNYLLAVDVDMTPLPGYRFANWDAGLWRLLGACPTCRRCAWCRGSRRPRW